MDMKALLEPKKGKKIHGIRNDKEAIGRNGSTNNNESVVPTTPSRSGAKTSSLEHVSPSTSRTFDHRALLNPRGDRSGIKLDPLFTEDSNHKNVSAAMDVDKHANGSTPRITNGPSGLGLIEQLHGTQRRMTERPVKKQKIDHTHDDSHHLTRKQQTSSHHGNAGVGVYFHPKAAEKTQTAVPAAIDLTGDDDDDGVEITEVRNIDDQEVCFGMTNGIVNAHKVPMPATVNPFAVAHAQWPVFKIDLARNKDLGPLAIECVDPCGAKFAKVGEHLASALAPAIDSFQKLRIQCRMMTRSRKPDEQAHQPCSDNYKVTLNIYGRRADVDKVGHWFGHKNIWFLSPMIYDKGIPLLNPHAKKPQLGQAMTTSRPPRVTFTRTMEEATNAVSRLFDHQAREGNLLQETQAPSSILTPLLPHQKQALTFMLKQEQPRSFDTRTEAGNSSLWRKVYDTRGQLSYEEVVTGIQQPDEPAQSHGGLLADTMGLGKTIQALALVASTAAEAHDFHFEPVQNYDEKDRMVEYNSKATLIVAPLSTIKNWEDQIKEHVQPDAMSQYVYHGQNRMRDAERLRDYDVVITTYHTAAYELKSKDVSPLLRIRWFRIVLDEAHAIRESKSNQSKAMFALHATRRWCLTGTPIQNRMDDLGSLTTFLRLYPYDTPRGFKQYVQAPAQSGDASFLKRLRVFVDSFTLRRLRDSIDLPNRKDLTVNLEFSTSERRLHDFFRERFAVAIKEISKQKEAQRGIGSQYHRVLKGITILRLICDHGKELLKPADLAEFKGSQPEDAIDVDALQPVKSITKQEAFEAFNLFQQADADICVLCHRKFGGDSPGSLTDVEENASGILAIMLPCKDMYCLDCFSQLRPNFEASKMQGFPVECDACESVIAPETIQIPMKYNDELQRIIDDSNNASFAFKNGTYEGPHTKTQTLLDDLAVVKQESQVLEAAGEPPIKSVIFSEFTSHLDLIAKALYDAGWEKTFARIDGSMSLSARRKVLDALNTDHGTTILLASIKAAGQGLNLTAASRAFIMEPMWNPAAEEQAVDRIYRIGQKREVIVRRYRIMDSIEDKIVQLQDRKKKLAEMSMEKASMQKMLSKKERNENQMKAMLDIFKG